MEYQSRCKDGYDSTLTETLTRDQPSSLQTTLTVLTCGARKPIFLRSFKMERSSWPNRLNIIETLIYVTAVETSS